MTISFLMLCIWALTANVIALFPSKRHHWPAAYALLAASLPLMGYVFYENDGFLIAAAILIWISTMRWPIRYGWKWIKRNWLNDL